MPDRPNVVLVTTDQQRHDTIPPQAPEWLRTPHTETLQRQGVTFSNAYSSCPICVPSRTSIMTGQNARTHGMFSNGSTSDVMGREGTLPSLMREEGYATAAIGKMHFDPPRARHGFDEMRLPFEYYREKTRSGDTRQPMRHGVGQNELTPTRATVPEGETLTDWIAEDCVDYVRERRDPTVPFFLWCSFSKPHPPLDPPEPYYSMYEDASLPDPVDSEWSDPEAWPPAFERWKELWGSFILEDDFSIDAARAAYYGVITQIDFRLGRLLSALSDVGELENTLLVYTSDHGEFLGDHGLGGKALFHEPSAHVPMIVRPPTNQDHDLTGVTCDAPVQLADLLPTFLGMATAGVDDGTDTAPDRCTGQDLLAVARGERDGREYVDAATDGPAAYVGITDGHHKYCWYPEGRNEQLFDLETDPEETTNRVNDAAYAGVREELRAELLRRHQASETPFVHDGDLVGFDAGGECPTDAFDTGPDPTETVWEGLRTEYSRDADVLH
jgi:arylsulfatase A-like enzyme